MITKKTCTLLLCMFIQLLAWSEMKPTPKNKIIIIEGPLRDQSDVKSLKVYPFRYDRFDPWVIKEIKQTSKNKYARWEIDTDVPVGLFNNLFSYSMVYLAEPGDSIYIHHDNNAIQFSGKGAEKFRLGKMVELLLDTLRGTPEGLSDGEKEPASSLADYFAWNAYLNKKIREWMGLLNEKKAKLSQLAYLDLKDRILRHIEKTRMHKFHSIRRSTTIATVNQFGLSNADLCRIYDSTMDNSSSKWLRYERKYIFSPDYVWEMLHDEQYRQIGRFFKTSKNDTPILGQDPTDEYIWKYNMIKEKYKGIVRENLLAYTFYSGSGVLRKIGFTPKVEMLLADYYALPEYPEFKKEVKEYEAKRRNKWNLLHAPTFTLTSSSGKQFNSAQLKGKIAVLDFWFTGCTGCIQMAPALRKLEKEFSSDTNVVFISISSDKSKEQWIKSVSEGKYTSSGGTQLYTDGYGTNHTIVKQLMIESYPTLELIDPDGLLIKVDKSKTDPRNDGGEALRRMLRKQLAIMEDGPYVFYQKDSIRIDYFSKTKGIRTSFMKSPSDTLKIMTDDISKTFSVILKPKLTTEPAEFEKPKRQLALSDIEGNFDQLRQLLQGNKVIDSHYNWTFGNGHLVFSGDMFDRGQQVTECLWLIYSLEEKAKAAGGYVHFILGNHEIMNLQGIPTYTNTKYKENASFAGRTLTELYSESNELGRWLRTKNIVEKIGDILYVHGGISNKLNRLPITVSEVNQLARPNYAKFNDHYEYGDNRINIIMNPASSPFWYRSYYDDTKEMSQIIDSSLQKFGVKHIITGHTIVADTISAYYDHKVINIDTKHAEGKSEALYIDNETYYRVNSRGERMFIFTESNNERTRKK